MGVGNTGEVVRAVNYDDGLLCGPCFEFLTEESILDRATQYT